MPHYDIYTILLTAKIFFFSYWSFSCNLNGLDNKTTWFQERAHLVHPAQFNLQIFVFHITRIEMVGCPAGQWTLGVIGTILGKGFRDSKQVERVGEASIAVKKKNFFLIGMKCDPAKAGHNYSKTIFKNGKTQISSISEATAVNWNGILVDQAGNVFNGWWFLKDWYTQRQWTNKRT